MYRFLMICVSERVNLTDVVVQSFVTLDRCDSAKFPYAYQTCQIVGTTAQADTFQILESGMLPTFDGSDILEVAGWRSLDALARLITLRRWFKSSPRLLITAA